MPKKRQSQPVQVWLLNADLLRLQHAAKRKGQTQSAIAREAILRVLNEFEKEFEKDDQEKAVHTELFDRFSKDSLKVISIAKNEADLYQATLVGSEHLLLALAAESGRTGKLLSKFGLSHSLIRNRIASGWTSIYSVVARPPYSPTLVRILDRSRLIAKRFHDRYVQPEHLLLAVLDQGTGFAYDILELLGLRRDDVKEAMKKQLPKLREERLWNRKG